MKTMQMGETTEREVRIRISNEEVGRGGGQKRRIQRNVPQVGKSGQ